MSWSRKHHQRKMKLQYGRPETSRLDPALSELLENHLVCSLLSVLQPTLMQQILASLGQLHQHDAMNASHDLIDLHFKLRYRTIGSYTTRVHTRPRPCTHSWPTSSRLQGFTGGQAVRLDTPSALLVAPVCSHSRDLFPSVICRATSCLTRWAAP